MHEQEESAVLPHLCYCSIIISVQSIDIYPHGPVMLDLEGRGGIHRSALALSKPQGPVTSCTEQEEVQSVNVQCCVC